MRLLQVIFSILWGLGYLGNGILFLYIEWSFLRQSFVQVFNPFLHLQVLGVLLTTRLFWIFLAMAIVGYYAVKNIEAYLDQDAKRTKKIIVKKLYLHHLKYFRKDNPVLYYLLHEVSQLTYLYLPSRHSLDQQVNQKLSQLNRESNC